MHRLTTAAILAAAVATLAAQAPPLNKQRVSFTSHGLTLAGFLFKPDGPGPFPAVVWNHGSEKNPGGGPQFDAVAGIFVPHGYVVFAPIRRGHEMSRRPLHPRRARCGARTRSGAADDRAPARDRAARRPARRIRIRETPAPLP